MVIYVFKTEIKLLDKNRLYFNMVRNKYTPIKGKKMPQKINSISK